MERPTSAGTAESPRQEAFRRFLFETHASGTSVVDALNYELACAGLSNVRASEVLVQPNGINAVETALGTLYFNKDQRSVMSPLKPDSWVHLSEPESEIIEALMSGKVLKKEDSSLTRGTIHLLREKLGDSGKGEIIKTLHGVGVFLSAPPVDLDQIAQLARPHATENSNQIERILMVFVTPDGHMLIHDDSHHTVLATLSNGSLSEPIELTVLENDILRALLQNPHGIVNSDNIQYSRRRDSRVMDKATLKTHVNHLRDKLNGDTEKPTYRFIKTIWNLGYSLSGLSNADRQTVFPNPRSDTANIISTLKYLVANGGLDKIIRSGKIEEGDLVTIIKAIKNGDTFPDEVADRVTLAIAQHC